MTDTLNLASVGVDVGERGEVVVNRMLASTNPRIWAAGDVAGHREFVYVAANHTGRIIGITAVVKDAGEIAAAGVYILQAGLTVNQVANMWSPYLTMAEGIKIACQSYTTEVSKLSCCAV